MPALPNSLQTWQPQWCRSSGAFMPNNTCPPGKQGSVSISKAPLVFLPGLEVSSQDETAWQAVTFTNGRGTQTKQRRHRQLSQSLCCQQNSRMSKGQRHCSKWIKIHICRKKRMKREVLCLWLRKFMAEQGCLSIQPVAALPQVWRWRIKAAVMRKGSLPYAEWLHFPPPQSCFGAWCAAAWCPLLMHKMASWETSRSHTSQRCE